MLSVLVRVSVAVVATMLWLSVAGVRPAVGQTSPWQVHPSYETPASVVSSTKLIIPDNAGVRREVYGHSTAVLIIEGAYRSGGWRNVSGQALESETLLRKAFEKRGYRVLVWRDLPGAQLRVVLDEVTSNLGYDPNGRLFIYYFGHGAVVGTASDPSGPRGFLVPVDAPDPVRDEQGFYKKALPISTLDSMASQMTTKHVFIALEACRAGSLFNAHLGSVPKSNPLGYLLNGHLQDMARQFLTAGDADQDVPATGLFTGVLAEGLDEADENGDGYVTGLELMNYVVLNIPQRSATDTLNPERGWRGQGDMIMGPALSRTTAEAPRSLPSGSNEQSTISSGISAQVAQVLAGQGDAVRKGQALFVLDSRPAQQALVEAQAHLRQHQQLLDSETVAHANLQAAVKAGRRMREELESEAIALNRYTAMVENDNADLMHARLELGMTRVSSPVCARVAKVFRQPGERVEVGTPLVRLEPTICQEAEPIQSAKAQSERVSVTAAPSSGETQLSRVPTWRRALSAGDLARYFPAEAKAQHSAGSATLECKIGVAGYAYACTVNSEQPSGMGFGDAALSLSRLFEFNPGLKDGTPVEGVVVRIPVNFTQPQSDSPATYIRKPNWYDVLEAFPELRSLQGKGALTLTCSLADNGTVFGCVAAGFGSDDPSLVQGALKMSRLFRFTPPTRDGKPILNAKVSIPIIFGTPSGG